MYPLYFWIYLLLLFVYLFTSSFESSKSFRFKVTSYRHFFLTKAPIQFYKSLKCFFMSLFRTKLMNFLILIFQIKNNIRIVEFQKLKFETYVITLMNSQS